MKPLKKGKNKEVNKMFEQGKKRFLAVVSYETDVNYNPQDMPDEYKNAGFYMESTHMVTHQTYKVIAFDKESVEEYVSAFVREGLPFGSKFELSVEEIES